MSKEIGSIDFNQFKEQITKQIMDAVNGLSDAEKEELLSRFEQNNEAYEEDDLWCTRLDSANKCYLNGYRGNDVNIILPDTINDMTYEIAAHSFKRSNVESITISSGVSAIGRMAFQNCDKLHTVIFADGFSGVIHDSAFMSCNSIKEFAFPTGIEILSCAVITRCRRLETVYIPNSVIEICAYALAENENLKNIYFDGTKSQWKSIQKTRYWNHGIGDYTVYCTDGKITVKK